MKDEAGPVKGAMALLRRLIVRRFRFKIDKSRRVHLGFFAHEAQKVAPYSVVGKKDGKNMQQMDHSKLVPLLTAAVQELDARIAKLESRK